jgi:hypothetical protein
MPADDGLHRMSTEDLAAFLRRLRALRMREGLSLDGLAAQGSLPPGSDGAGQPGFTITQLGPRQAPRPGPRRSRWRPSPGLVGVTATAMVLAGLAVSGVVLMEPTGHSEANAPSAALPGAGQSMVGRGGWMHMHTIPAAPSPAGPRAARPSPHRAMMPGKTRVRVVVPVLVRPKRMGTEVAGVGCPSSPNDGISLADASTGPGWTTAGGGWAGNGCDGSSVWTMDPNGTSASTLTWFFYPSMRASSCQLAVFVPSQNALGTGDYQISAGPASLGSVSIDQADDQGQWVPLGSYPATGGMLTVQLLPGTATLTAATGNGGNGNGHGNGGSGNGNGGSGHGGSGGGQATPSPSPASGHNAAVAASAARASCR